MTDQAMTDQTMTDLIKAQTVETTRRSEPSLNILDIALQTLTVVMLIATIVAVQARLPHYHYMLVAPILSIGLWASAGLIIDRQALVGQRSSAAATNARG